MLCLGRKLQVQGLRSAENQGVLSSRDDCFQHDHNEEIGVFDQALVKFSLLH